MKDFVLDSTYKDSIIVNSNGDIITTASCNIPSNSIVHHGVNLNNTNLNYSNTHRKNDKFNSYNLIDYF
ncbi:hypothetical protein CDLVIII_0306 [Clostridium sp. DL-VIII]|nr:hypothetical protein CDLVIII_0306 [Clostridium sp. DL-VIII]OOM75324.1 hypothetical protein CLOBL_40500 [Clostridium sp. BL-8]